MNDKNSLREKLKIKRRYFSGYRRQTADIAVLENFLNAYGGYESFFIYNSFGTETDTKALVFALLAENKKVYLPRVDGENMQAVRYLKNNGMRKGAFGIEEPEGQAFSGDIDITVIPLLAVNPRGFRVGYGKGFYDKYLNKAHTKKIGLGYSFQIEEFQEDAHDVPLDAFVCEKGIYYYATDK